MFESIINFFKKLTKTENKETKSKETAKERLHLVLMQDRANVSADFLEMMKQEIIEVIKKYIEVDEKEIDVRLTNEVKADGTTGAPSLYANIPIVNIKNEMKKDVEDKQKETPKKEDTKKQEAKKEDVKEDDGKQEESKEKVQQEEVKSEDKVEQEEVKSEDKEEPAENQEPEVEKKDTKKQEAKKEEETN